MDASTEAHRAAGLLRFWQDAGPRRWFRKDAAFDAEFRDGFLDLHQAAARGDLQAWTLDANTCLALLLLLDQFPRNPCRGPPPFSSTAALARGAAGRAPARR